MRHLVSHLPFDLVPFLCCLWVAIFALLLSDILATSFTLGLILISLLGILHSYFEHLSFHCSLRNA